MTKFQHSHSRIRLVRVLLAPCLLSFMGAGSVIPASPAVDDKAGAADALARYRHERDLCMSSPSTQSRESCLHEAAAVFESSRKRAPQDDATERMARTRGSNP